MESHFKQYFLFPIILAGLIPLNADAQTNKPSGPLPSAYYTLSKDTARMRFLMNTINDSLNSGQLNLVYVWQGKAKSLPIRTTWIP